MDPKLTNDNIFFLTSAFSRKLGKQADEEFAVVGLSSSHALLLYLIDENPQIQPGKLAEMLHLQPSTITRLVQKLERRGLIIKESEGRSTSIVCTNDGQELAISIRNTWEQLIQKKREELGERYLEVLSEMIANALDAIEQE